MPEDDFAELVRRAAEGSEAAARQLLEVYGHHIRRVVRRKLERSRYPVSDSLDYLSELLPSVLTPDELRRHQADRPETLIDGLTDTLCTHIVHSVGQPGGRPTVLVVDDEDAIRKLLDVALRGLGLDVRLASGGREAVDVYRAHADAIDLVLIDVQMPGLDGPQALAALRQVNPAIRCCFMTGHAGAYTVEQLKQLGAAAILEKPFPSLADLARTLRQVAGK